MASINVKASTPEYTVVTIRFDHKSDHDDASIYVLSNCNEWQPQQMATEDGSSTYTHSFNVPRHWQTVHWKFRIGESQWAIDPDTPTEHDGFGGANNRFDIPHPELSSWDTAEPDNPLEAEQAPVPVLSQGSLTLQNESNAKLEDAPVEVQKPSLLVETDAKDEPTPQITNKAAADGDVSSLRIDSPTVIDEPVIMHEKGVIEASDDFKRADSREHEKLDLPEAPNEDTTESNLPEVELEDRMTSGSSTIGSSGAAILHVRSDINDLTTADSFKAEHDVEQPTSHPVAHTTASDATHEVVASQMESVQDSPTLPEDLQKPKAAPQQAQKEAMTKSSQIEDSDGTRDKQNSSSPMDKSRRDDNTTSVNTPTPKQTPSSLHMYLGIAAIAVGLIAYFW